MSRIKSHLIYDHFKKYSGVPFYFKTSRDKLQPWTQVLEKNPPILHFNVALEIVSIDCVDNPTRSPLLGACKLKRGRGELSCRRERLFLKLRKDANRKRFVLSLIVALVLVF